MYMKLRIYITRFEHHLTTLIMDFIREFWLFFRTRKKYWLLPLLFFLLLLGALSFITTGSVLAPFIYSIF